MSDIYDKVGAAAEVERERWFTRQSETETPPWEVCRREESEGMWYEAVMHAGHTEESAIAKLVALRAEYVGRATIAALRSGMEDASNAEFREILDRDVL